MKKIANAAAQYIFIFLLFNVNFAVVEYMQKISKFQSINTESTCQQIHQIGDN
jgi:hypothetical protein